MYIIKRKRYIHNNHMLYEMFHVKYKNFLKKQDFFVKTPKKDMCGLHNTYIFDVYVCTH